MSRRFDPDVLPVAADPSAPRRPTLGTKKTTPTSGCATAKTRRFVPVPRGGERLRGSRSWGRYQGVSKTRSTTEMLGADPRRTTRASRCATGRSSTTRAPIKGKNYRLQCRRPLADRRPTRARPGDEEVYLDQNAARRRSGVFRSLGDHRVVTGPHAAARSPPTPQGTSATTCACADLGDGDGSSMTASRTSARGW